MCRNIVAPMLVRPHKLFSNFWGAIASNGFYSRAHDYREILNGERKYDIRIHVPASFIIYLSSSSISPPPPLSLLFNDRGVWNIPFVTGAMLISGKLLTQLKDDLPSYESDELDPDMAFAEWMRERVSHFFFPLCV